MSQVPKYYVNHDGEISTFELSEIQAGLDAGRFVRTTLVCAVGASEWSAIEDTRDLNLRLPELSSSAHVLDSDLVTEKAPEVALTDPQGRILEERRARPKLSLRTKLTIGAWTFCAFVCLAVILQRNGHVYSAASWLGFGKGYEAMEQDLLGGPGEHTVRGAQRLWDEAEIESGFERSKEK